ncbi:(2E,6E)-farnesyl diphosphate synthase [Algicola sagamiensis]|uniref:(2E,6E)-farnesyl diphosphate synthase n=1 Tax=Algicola sagamiensis TaxID=163869 RepID=UPI0003726005|nr:farnesyl diphosphate synthase [Algicola sagamiensis]
MNLEAVMNLEVLQQRVSRNLIMYLERLHINDPKLMEALTYVVQAGGKRIRPFLVYQSGLALGASAALLDYPAAAVELIHTYSLVHDDLPALDNDDLRRGKPTCHVAFDEATAILVGDTLQTLAYDVLSTSSDIAAETIVAWVRILSKATGYEGMCGGQALDLASTGKQINLDALTQIHTLKTGALIEASVTMGAVSAGYLQDSDEFQALRTYAHHIGLAFQIQDDILDVVGETAVIGKPQGSDEAAEKSTYVARLGLDEAQHSAQEHVRLAQAALASLKQHDMKALSDFATFIIHRDH